MALHIKEGENLEDKKYYWLKLKRDFFKRHDIQIIEAMPNGKDYVLFYLKLLAESVDHNGHLRFSEMIPYNEEMLAVITRTNIDIVKAAMKLFNELQMVDILDDKTIYLNEINSMLGGESYWAEQKRKQRIGHCPTNVQLLSDVSPTCPSKSKSKSKSKSIDKEIDIFSVFSSGNESLLSALNDFAKMRKTIKAPMTEKAKQLLNAKLEKISGDSAVWIELLNDAIEKSWKSVYPKEAKYGGDNKTDKPIPDRFSNLTGGTRL